MKICSEYPELKNRLFDSIEECAAEEAKIDAARKSKQEDEEKCQETLTAATEAFKKARAELRAARNEAEKIRAEAVEKMTAITAPAEAKAQEAYDAMMKARMEYDEKHNKKRVVCVGPGHCSISKVILADILRDLI